ncbi:MAG: SPOR domain-containing protein [Rhodobacteraceae bacterium]|nr:SPOR domain-containing protein [Paracoccaceae bacterium]
MRLMLAVTAAFFAFGSHPQPAMAQQWTLANIGGPRNPPPPDFRGREFVDSRGCVFIRAGSGAVTNWVPRVDRGRRVLCGQPPTRVASAGPRVTTIDAGGLAAAGTAQPTGTRTAALAAPVRQVTRQPAAQPTGAPGPTVFETETSRAREEGRLRVPAAAAPGLVVASGAPRAPATGAQAAATRVANATCPDGRPAIHDGLTVRCGPQGIHPGDFVRQQGGTTRGAAPTTAPVVAPGRAAPSVGTCPDGRPAMHDGLPVRCGPQPIHPGDFVRQQGGRTGAVIAPGATTIPAGYVALNAAGQPNPASGRGTAAGDAATDLVWTRTVPRRLIERSTGRDVTMVYQGVTYPALPGTMQPQRSGGPAAAVGSSTPRMVVPPQPVRVVGDSGATAQPTRVVAASTRAAPAASVTMSSRSPDPSAAPRAATANSGSLVQVATFGEPANATRTRARFEAAGMPVQTRNLSRGGRALQIVYLGPFADESQLNAALRAARGAGFRDAFVAR